MVLMRVGACSTSRTMTRRMKKAPPSLALSVLKRCVPKTLAFAFGLRLRSKTLCFRTRVLGRRLPNGKPQERLRFKALRSQMLASKRRIAIISVIYHRPLNGPF